MVFRASGQVSKQRAKIYVGPESAESLQNALIYRRRRYTDLSLTLPCLQIFFAAHTSAVTIEVAGARIVD